MTDANRPFPLIDTHCHLEMKQFDDDRAEVIRRAADAGFEALITVGSTFQSVSDAIELAERHDFIYATVGIHPHDAKDFSENIYARFKEWSTHSKVVAVGETGLDYHYDHSPRETQRDIFRRHIELARECGLPLIVHSREAQEDTMTILSEQKVDRGALHCFSGDMAMAEKAMSLGLYISFAGPVTFKKALQLKEIARIIPDDYLLIETDAPYLSPEPFRGKRNEPAYLRHTAEHIASLRGISTEDIARITTLNAKRLFGIGVIEEQGEIAYRIRDSLYLNVTNRCTNKCSFCVRSYSDFVKGHRLRLDHEPSEQEIIAAIGDPARYREVVFCGYGEPLIRLEVVRHVARWIKDNKGTVRINTNGQANLIHRKDVMPELKGLVDSMSISLDAQDEETYNKLCLPAYKNAYSEVIRFIKQAKEMVPEVQVTIVDAEGVDVEKCRMIAENLGVLLRVRKLDVVG